MPDTILTFSVSVLSITCNMECLEVCKEGAAQWLVSLHFSQFRPVFAGVVSKSHMDICRYPLSMQWDMGHITTLTRVFSQEQEERRKRRGNCSCRGCETGWLKEEEGKLSLVDHHDSEASSCYFLVTDGHPRTMI